MSENSHPPEAPLGWPDALWKATMDPFDYAAMVRGLGPVRFQEAEPLRGDWVRLKWEDGAEGFGCAALPWPCPRGVEVRLEDIICVADAPQGS